MILIGLINQIPVVTFHNLSEALCDSVQSHIKTYVEPLLTEHWQSLGLAKDYTVSPSDEFTAALQGVDEQFRMLREQLRGNKRARLTDEKRANLAHEEAKSSLRGFFIKFLLQPLIHQCFNLNAAFGGLLFYLIKQFEADRHSGSDF